MKKLAFGLLTFALLLTACNLPTRAAMETPTPAFPPTETSQATVTLAVTETPAATATPQKPVVLRDTLCWKGPGIAYEVVSALKVGAQLELIGRGTISGWWVIVNPIYKDACWVQAVDIQIDPGFDISSLKLIAPPPLPTATWTPSVTPTPTP